MRAHAWYYDTMDHKTTGFSELFELIGVMARRRYQIGERYFASLGLNHTEARMLTLLELAGGRTTQDVLSNMLHVDRSNAGRALKGLEQRGLILRIKDSSNGKTNLVTITESGREIAAEIGVLRHEMAQMFFGELTEDQAEHIVDLLRKAGVLDASPKSKGLLHEDRQDSPVAYLE